MELWPPSQAGKAVLTEKPFARNATEAEVVREAAHRRGTVVMEGFHYLFHPIIKRMFGLLSDGTLGTLQHVEVVMKMPEPKPDDARWKLQLAGGCVMDLGCYGLHVNRQLARFAGGDPTIVSARGTERSPGVDASFDIDLAFPTGASGSIISSMTAERYEMTLRLIGDKSEAFAHDYLLQYGDDRIEITTDAGTTVEHLGTRSTTPTNCRPSPTTSSTARRCHSTSTMPSRTCNTSTPPTPRPACPHADRTPQTVSIDVADISVGHALFPPP